jgi:hypothetical protein
MRLSRPDTVAAKLAYVARDLLRTTPRGAAEFLIVVAVFATCDPTPMSLIVGGATCAVGELARIAAAGFGYNVGELSLRGPYRLVRHPYFLGSALLFLGLSLAGRNAYVAGGATLLLILVYRHSYRHDEDRLAVRLGPRFADYRERVPAFIPQLLPAPAMPQDNRQFSLEYALLRGRHRELDALLGLGLAFGLFALAAWTVSKDLFHLSVVAVVGVYLTGRFIYYGVARRRRAA